MAWRWRSFGDTFIRITSRWAGGLSLLGGLALYGSNRDLWLLLAIPVIALGRTSLNALDGLVARDTGLARPWGEVLNEVCDLVSDVLLFSGAALERGSSRWLGATVLVVMLLSSCVGVVSRAAGGRRQYGGVMGKADRMIFLAIATVVAFVLPEVHVLTYFLAIVLIGLLLTAVQRLRSTYVDLEFHQ
ncbi:MAG: CDP-alcohol phosphatidyltransferase family protein [Chloroflexota bacterium]